MKRFGKEIVASAMALLLLLGPVYPLAAQPLSEEELDVLVGSEMIISDMEKPGAALNPEAAVYGTMKSVSVEGMSFDKALQFTTSVQPQSTYSFQYVLPVEGRIEQHDVLLATFYARTISSTHETAEGNASLVMERKESWDKSLNESIAIPSTWKKFLIPIKAALLMEENNSQMTFRLGYTPQVVEIADLKVVNYKKLVAFEELPSTPVYYEGMEPDAPWRAEAEARIEQYRKGHMTVQVTDAAGRPLSDAQVQVEMTRHDFKFGTAVNSNLIFGTDGNAQQYREKLKENFNSVVMENEMKWPWWESDKARTVKLYNWLGEQELAVRGHTLVWDNTRRLPTDVGGLLNDTDALNTRIKNHIDETAGYFRGRLYDWDVINEPVLNSLIRSGQGDQVAADWIKEAKAADPYAKLYVNETQILGIEAPVIGQFSTFLQSLKDNGAPLDGIGIQAHFGSTPVSPMAFYNQVSHFAQYADEIAITEYDMNTPKEDVQGQFTHDLLLAMFSHPNVKSFTMWGFWDGAHWQNNAPLYRSDWTLKPSGEAWRELIYNKWWTRENGVTDQTGSYELRGFYGDYEITVTQGGKSQKMEASLQKGESGHISVVWGQVQTEKSSFIPLPLPAQNADITAPVWPYGEAFTLSERSPTSLRLNWPSAYDNVGVERYVIYCNDEQLDIVASNVTSYDVRSLDPAMGYSFNVVAVDQAGNTSVQGILPAAGALPGENTTIPEWNKGSVLTLERLTSSGVALQWHEAVDDVGVLGYRVYVDGRIAGDTELPVYELSGLTANTLYTVRVEARDESGNLSLAGPILTFRTLAAMDVTAPVWSDGALESESIGSDSVRLNWTGAYDENGIAAYRIYQDGREVTVVSGTEESYLITGLSEDTIYAFSIEAADNSGNWSSTVPETIARTQAVGDTMPPSWPTGRSLNYSAVGDTKVSLNWSAAIDSAGIRAYQLFCNGQVIADLTADVLSYDVLNLSPGQSYTFKVEASDSVGNWTMDGPAVTVLTSSGLVRTQHRLYPVEDTFIQAPAAYGGTGSNQNLNYLRFKNAAGVSGLEQTKNTGNNRRVFLKFPLDSVTGNVYEASLNLYIYAVQTPNMDIAMHLRAVDDQWTETGLLWDNQPAEGILLGSQVFQNAPSWKTFDVKDYIDQEASGDRLASFKLQDENWGDQNVDIYSREADGVNADYRPYLLVSTEESQVDVDAPVWNDQTLEATNIKPTSLRVTWNGAVDETGVNGYVIYVDGMKRAVMGADIFNYDITELQPNTAYVVRIEATDGNQETVSGPEITVQTALEDQVPPQWPQANLTVSEVSGYEATLSWTAASDEYGIKEYVIYKNGAVFGVVSGDTLTYWGRGLLPETSYVFQIAARDEAGNETLGAELIVHTEAADQTAPVWGSSELAAIRVTPYGMGLRWGRAQDNLGIEYYRIYKDGQTVAEVSGGVTSYFVTGLRPASVYRFQLEAVDAAGNVSAPLLLEDALTPEYDSVTPQWPTGSRIIAETMQGGIRLAWDPALDNTGIAYYKLYRNGELLARISADTMSYSVPDSRADDVYKVEAEDLAGNESVFGPTTNDSAIPVPEDTTPPEWPHNSRLSADSITMTSVRLYWNAAVDRIGVEEYKILLDGKEVGSTDQLQWTVSGLSANSLYTCKVEAVDAAGNWSIVGPELTIRTRSVEDSGSRPIGGSSGEQPPWDVNNPVKTKTEGPQIQFREGRTTIAIASKDMDQRRSTASIELNEGILEKAFVQARERGDEAAVLLEIEEISDTTSYLVHFPAKHLTGGRGLLELRTGIGRVLLPINMLQSAGEDDRVTLGMSRTSSPVGSGIAGTLSAGFDLVLLINDKPVAAGDGHAEVEIYLPYLVSGAEAANLHALSIWHVDAAGNTRLVPTGRYHEDTSGIYFRVGYTGLFTVAFNPKSFADLDSAVWARLAVEELASKGILHGVSSQLFSPQTNVRRADFVKMLVGALGLTADMEGPSFADIHPEQYHAEAVSIARELGIVQGGAQNLFHPDATLSRQDMIVMVARALSIVNQASPAITDDHLSAYTDRKQVASYALEGIAELLGNGLIQGNDGRIEPKRQATRAEAAVLMQRLLHFVYFSE